MKMKNAKLLGALGAAALGVGIASGLAGCELVVDFDRTLIDGGVIVSDSSTFDVVPQDVQQVDAGQDVVQTAPRLEIILPSKDFGSVVANATSGDVTFTVWNRGDAPSGVPSASLTGTDAAQFSISTNNCTAAIAPNGNCTILVKFAPTSAGVKTASLSVTATPGNAVTSTLTGTGLAPNFNLSLTPTNKDYGSVNTGSSSADTQFTLKNTGNAATGVPAVSLTGSDKDQFTIGTSTCTAVLAPNATCTINVKFSPTTAGSKSASLSVNASPGGTIASTLTGMGVGPAALSISPTTKDFGNAATSSTNDKQAFTVTNNGGLVSGTPTITFTGNDPTQFTQTNNCPTTGGIAPNGGTCTITVTFTPTTTGAKSATLSVSATPGGNPTATLSGTGVNPALLTGTPNPLIFPSALPNNTTAAQTVTIQNTGGVAATVPTVNITGTNASEFAVSQNNCTTALAPNATCTILVTSTPAATGPRTATLNVNATTGGNVAVTLNGYGAAQAGAALTVSPTSQDFGTVAVNGTSSPPVTFTVTNTGVAATANDLAIAITGQFTINTNGCSNQLQGGTSCQVLVVFSPTSAGPQNGSLSASATGVTTATATLTGTGQ